MFKYNGGYRVNKDTKNDKNTDIMETIKEVGIPELNNPIQF